LRAGFAASGRETRLAIRPNIDSTLARQMTMEQETGSKRNLVPVLLPWLVAAGALVVYLTTLNRWVSFGSLLPVAKLSGWTWQPDLCGPLFWLVSYPLRWLPAHLIPLALNLIAAVCAALTLALLARSVILLPHDRTHEQREREQSDFCLLSIPLAWIPPVLAALVCGLQLTFWENATSGQMIDRFVVPYDNRLEMLDVLLFAYIIRCLLEYRIDGRDSWLFRAVFLWGLMATSNWTMIALLPLLLVSLVWTKRLSFFEGGFPLKSLLWLLAGLSLYLLLPLVQTLGGHHTITFWEALKHNLSVQKSALSSYYGYFNSVRHDALMLALISLVPIVIISFRWASYFGDSSRIGIFLATVIFHLVHVLFLFVCIWVALDPPFSPRNKNLFMPMLTLSYLGALSVGYFTGYLLLVFRPTTSRRAMNYWPVVSKGVVGAVWLLLLGVPALLLYRNLPQIRITNGPMLRQFAAFQAQALPPHNAVVLSDDPYRLFLARSFLTQNGRDKDYMFLETSSLQFPDYQRKLKRDYPQRWTEPQPKDQRQPVDDIHLMGIMARMAATNSVYYLHPSFGYYFEVFDMEPHGVAYKLNRSSTNTLMLPPLSKEVLNENETFWANADKAALAPVVAAITPPGTKPGPLEQFMAKLHLEFEPNRDATLLANFYSRSLDYWGVVAQQSGSLTNGASHFERTLDLNADNRAAQINLECNKQLQEGHKLERLDIKTLEERFGRYNWTQILNIDGPLDDPSFCYGEGLVLASGRLYRQAAQQFDRAATLAPDDLDSRAALAQMYVIESMSDQALKVVNEIHSRGAALGLNRTNQARIVSVEMAAHLGKHDVKSAENALNAALAQSPGDENLLVPAGQVYLAYGVSSNGVAALETALEKHAGDVAWLTAGIQAYMAHNLFSNAVLKLDHLLKLDPNNTGALVNKGFSCVQMGCFDQAIPSLTQAMELETNKTSDIHNCALLNRAVAYLRSEKLDEARSDYETLHKSYPKLYQVYYGLGEIAYRKKDTNVAVRNYRLYLTNAPPGTEEAKFVMTRLKELQPSAR
jgi:tetratricopeptide (TPR) repeat protein